MNQIKLDKKHLQEIANQAATKAYEKAIYDYYTDYNSPYCKAIMEELKEKSLHYTLELPNIIGKLNKGLSAKIDEIANTAIAKTFIPLVQNFLTNIEGNIKFSDILKKCIEISGYERDREIEDDDFSINNLNFKDKDFLHFSINCPAGSYKFFFSLNDKYDKIKKEIDNYSMCYLPELETTCKNYKTMKLQLGDATLEMPFVSSVLSDNFVSYCANIIMSNSKITFDCTNFEEWLFPERNHCSCD